LSVIVRDALPVAKEEALFAKLKLLLVADSLKMEGETTLLTMFITEQLFKIDPFVFVRTKFASAPPLPKDVVLAAIV
jgi:hypothetical protein